MGRICRRRRDRADVGRVQIQKPRLAEAGRGLRLKHHRVPMFAYFLFGQQFANRLSSPINGDALQNATTAGLPFLLCLPFASPALMPRPVNKTPTPLAEAA